MKKIMILGASILQLPAILKAKEMGLKVIAVDMDKNAIGFKYADICLEISTIDTQKVMEAAQLYDIDGIMTLASDMPMRTVASVASKLSIVGINEETALRATDKGIMRECLEDNNVPIPKFARVNNYKDYLEVIENISGKLIIKPSDNSGSRGVFLLEDKNNEKLINHAFNYSKEYSRNGEIIIEEYMEGPEVSVEAISVRGKVEIITITDKLTTGAPNFVEMGHSQPTRLSIEIQESVNDITKKAIEAIGIKNGPSHTEIIVTNDGPKIVEIGARLGGDNITSHLVPLSTGIDMIESCIKIAIGEEINLTKKIQMGSAIRYIETKAGKIDKILGVDNARLVYGVENITILKKNGDIVSNINSSSDRIGFIIAKSDSANKAIDICNKSKSFIDIRMEK